ncbi:MAG: glycosyltransferase family 39 protein [Candidatus Hydrogenedentes bacterium]|nr:glycosyltransferase family 39 protein [Candidatus Hydrogenedentota bacterium]
MFNESAFRYINTAIQNPILDQVLPVFSDKSWVVIPGVALAGAVLYSGSRRTRLCVLALAAAVALADLSSVRIVKELARTPRPYVELDGVRLHRGGQWTVSTTEEHEENESYSFPSSHAANVAAAAAALAVFRRRTLWGTAPAVFLVGLSRVYTGHHYVEDVLAGAALGVICGATCGVATRRLGGRWVQAEPEARQTATPASRTLYLVLASWTLLTFAFIYTGLYDLAGDEDQYWDWSRRLDLGYYSKTPLIAYVIHVLVRAGGNEAWAVRSGAVLLSTLTLALLHALTLRISRSERTALLAVCMALGCPAFWVGSVVMTPDAPLCFFWVLALYAFHRAVHGETRWWWMVGLGLGLGLLSKYTMALLISARAAYLLLVDRSHLRKPGPYVAIAIAVLSTSGVVYWNWTHDWVSFRHTASIGAGDVWSVGRAGRNLAEFLGAQFVVVSPLLLVLVLWAVWWCLRRWRGEHGRAGTGTDEHGPREPKLSRGERDAALLVLAFLAAFGTYAIVSIKNRPEPNWAVCAYLAGIPALAWVWRRQERGIAAQRTLALGIALGVLMGAASRSTDLLYVAGSAFSPDVSGKVRLGQFKLDPDADPTNALRGGHELGAALSKHRDDDSEDAPFIFSDRYQLTAWATFYTEGRPHAYCMNIGDRRYNQYDLWGGWEDLAGKDGLFVTGGDPLKTQAFIVYMVAQGAFESGELIDTVTVRRGKTIIKTFNIALMRGYSGKPWTVRAEKY